MNRILQKYGKKDDSFLDRKILFVNLKYNKLAYVKGGYYFKLKIDDARRIIYIETYDENYNFIEEVGYVYFDSLKERLNIKLSKIALVWASKRKIEGSNYFRYYKMQIFEYKGFETFLDLVKKGIIKISIIGRVSKSGLQSGKQKNKSLVFQISKQDLKMLGNEVETIDMDYNEYCFFNN